MKIRHGNHFLQRRGPGGKQDGSGEREWLWSPITCPLWDHQARSCRERTKRGIRSRHRGLELGGDRDRPWTWDSFEDGSGDEGANVHCHPQALTGVRMCHV